jgi:hypothetical protein
MRRRKGYDIGDAVQRAEAAQAAAVEAIRTRTEVATAAAEERGGADGGATGLLVRDGVVLAVLHGADPGAPMPGGAAFVPYDLADAEVVIGEGVPWPRLKRDRLLAGTDWTQAPDQPEARREAFAAYRQALRDLPGRQPDPLDVTWPDAPAT